MIKVRLSPLIAVMYHGPSTLFLPVMLTITTLRLSVVFRHANTTFYCALIFQCIHVPNRGFIVGSYKCVCRDGYYHPDPTTKYFDGAYVEQVFSNGTLNAIPDMFACKRCREGCITCVTDKPCIVETDYHMRYSILGVNLGSVFMCFGITVFIWRCREIQVRTTSIHPVSTSLHQTIPGLFFLVGLVPVCLLSPLRIYLEIRSLVPSSPSSSNQESPVLLA